MKLAAALVFAGAQALGPAAQAQPADVQSALPGARLAGEGRLVVWGFEAYEASLWAGPAFRADDWASQDVVLVLTYARDFTAEAIAARSLTEMRRQAPIDEALAARWQRQLQSALPDVRRGDRIAGVYRPGSGLQFVVNGRPGTPIDDAALARLFFGIWLSPRTSEPALRRALLARAGTAS
jgi:hypothetical protein